MLGLQSDNKPVLHGIEPHEHDDKAWLVHANPMGLDTTLEVRLDGELVDQLPLAQGDYRRHTVVRLSEQHYVPGKTLEVSARNDKGFSKALSIVLE